MQVTLGVPNYIEGLQIHPPAAAASFLRQWQGHVTSLRFEPVTLADGNRCLGVDYVLVLPDGSRALIVLGALYSEPESLCLPSLMVTCPETRQRDLADLTAKEFLAAGRSMPAVRWLPDHHRVGIDPSVLEGRAIPALCPYVTAVNHIKRYRFAASHLLPGTTIDCACGVGYGSEILIATPTLASYAGVDVDPEAVALARKIAVEPRAQFFAGSIDSADIPPATNVVSLKTLEHVEDPHRFLELLIQKMQPDGRAILSIPAEYWAGSHLNRHHVTNWNFARLHRLLSAYFEHFEIFKQQLSLIGSDTFNHSDIFARPSNPAVDETFVAIASRPRTASRRSRIVIRRDHALGDTILATPLVESIRSRHPDRQVVAVTRHTEVFMNNPNADIVATPAFEPDPMDEVIDLNGMYEANREQHILEAYASAAPQSVSNWMPRLFPSQMHFQCAARRMLDRWEALPIERVLAIHAAATSPDRIWPRDYWQEFLSSALRDNRTGLLVVGAAKDFDLAALDLTSEPSAVSFVSSSDLLTTAAALALSDILVCPDSGLSHVASAVGTRTLVLYGMADPSTRASLTGSSTTIWSEVECRNCLRTLPASDPPLCKLEKSICMESIKPAVVYSSYRSLMESVPVDTWRRRVRAVGISAPVASSRPPSGDSPPQSKKVGILSRWRR